MSRGRPRKQIQTNEPSILDEAQAELAKKIREKQKEALVYLLEERFKKAEQIKRIDESIKKINAGDTRALAEVRRLEDGVRF